MIIKLTLNLEIPGHGAIYSKYHSLDEDEGTYQELILVTGSVDSVVAFGGVTIADVVFIESDRQISYRQVVGETLTVVDEDRVHIMVGTQITALLLTNISGTDANVRILVAGT